MEERYTSVSVKKKKSVKGQPWEAWMKYKDAQGKWRNTRKTLKGAKGKKEAERMAEEWRVQMNEQARANSKVIKPKAHRKSIDLYVNVAVRDFLLHQAKLKKVNTSTLVINESNARNHIYPYFEGRLITSITREDIQEWHEKLLENLAPSTAGTAHSVLRKAFYYYAEKGVIAYNPFEYIKSPKVKKKEINYLRQEDRTAFEMALGSYKVDDKSRNNHAYNCGVWLAYFTGMRAGEICGLQWGDIHLALKYLDIRRAVGRDGKRGYIKEPKNRTSARRVYLIPQVIERLKEHKTYVLECLQKTDPSIRDVPSDYFVIGRDSGREFAHPAFLSNYFSRFVRLYGIKGSTGEYLKLHDLRHTFATMAVQSGMDIKSLSSLLGHANAEMTLNTYASSDSNATRNAMKQYASFLEDD